VPDEISTGELDRRLSDMRAEMRSQFDKVNHHIEALQFVSRDTYLVQMQALTERLVKLEDAKTWLSRAVVVSLLFPILAAIVIALLVASG